MMLNIFLLELKNMNWAKRACMLHVNVNREQGQDNLETWP